MRTYLLVIALIFGCQLSIFAQDRGFTASVSKTTVSSNENFNYTLTLINQEGQIQRPDLSDFDILAGPSTQSSFKNFNGKVSQEFSETYVLRAKKTGSLTIPPAKARVATGIIQTEPIKMTVVKGTAPSPQSVNSNFFTDVTVSKKRVYVGEPLVATFRIYMRYRDLRDADVKYPDLEGFWSETVESNSGWQIEVVNGRQYRVITTKYEVLFPQTAGDITIDPFVVTATCTEGFFDRGQRLTATSKPIKIEVEPVPPHASEGFLGTFPKLSLATEINKTELVANEAINLSVKFSGKGNLKFLGTPQFELPPDFETYEPKVVDNITINASGESGSRRFDFVFIPRSAGQYVIPEVAFEYFDPDDSKIKSLTIPEMVFSVARGNGDENVGYTFDPKTDVNVLSQGIRYIKTDTVLESPSSRFFGSTAYYLCAGAPLLLLVFLLAWRKKQEREGKNPELFRQKKAGRMAKKHLGNAERMCESGQSREFFLEVHAAILGYLTDKFGMAMSELNYDRIEEEIMNRAGQDFAQQTVQLLNLCERARYAPVTDVGERELLSRATETINAIEQQVS